MSGIVLILGANGRFGRNAVDAFWNAGWSVRTFDRTTDTLPDAAIGADVIVNAWNPPYTDWPTVVPELTKQVIEAAKSSGANVIIPGNVYVFGPNASDRFAADTAHGATNELGCIRIDMEAAYRRSGVKTIVLRAGDFLDTEASGNWFDMIITKRIAKGRFSYPGDMDVPHAWAYLPDMARAAVELAEIRGELDAFTDVPFAGFTLTGHEMAELCQQALGRPVRAARMSWLPIQLMSPVWAMGRRLIEMRYLWSKPHHLDGSRLAELLPQFRATPMEEAIASALQPNIHPDKPVARPLSGVAAE